MGHAWNSTDQGSGEMTGEPELPGEDEAAEPATRGCGEHWLNWPPDPAMVPYRRRAWGRQAALAAGRGGPDSAGSPR